MCYFGSQHWHLLSGIVLQHITGTVNAANDLTKALSWFFHARHSRFLMGHLDSLLLSALDLIPVLLHSPGLGGSQPAHAMGTVRWGGLMPELQSALTLLMHHQFDFL